MTGRLMPSLRNGQIGGCCRPMVLLSLSTPPATDDTTRCQARVLEACNMPLTRVVAARGHDNATIT